VNIPPEKIVELLDGTATGGAPTAMPRAQIAAGLGVSDRSEAFRELMRSLAAAGFVIREHVGGQWVYRVGRPLDDMAGARAAGPAPNVDPAEFERALADVERNRRGRRPAGAVELPENARATVPQQPGPRGRRPGSRPAPRPRQAAPVTAAVHGTLGDLTLCGLPSGDLPMQIPLRDDYDGPLRHRETTTTLFDRVTCVGCVDVRDRRWPAGSVHAATESMDRTLCGLPTRGMDVYGTGSGPTWSTDHSLTSCTDCLSALARNELVHGAVQRDRALCGRSIEGMAAVGPPLSEGWTTDLSIINCRGCMVARDTRRPSPAGDTMFFPAPGSGTRHGRLPGVDALTACGEPVAQLPDGETVAEGGLIRPSCHPCIHEIDVHNTEGERRRQAADDLAANLYVHLYVDPNHEPLCGIMRAGLFLPEGHSLTNFAARANCTDCLARHGAPTSYPVGAYAQGRADQAAGTVDTTRTADRGYVQGLSDERTAQLERDLAALQAAVPAGECTYAGSFTREHRFEHRPEEVLASRQGNGGYDEYERCQKQRTHVVHLGEPEADRAWLADQFEYDDCPDCGRRASGHEVVITDGGRITRCVEQSRLGLDDYTPGDTGPQIDRPLAGDRITAPGPAELDSMDIHGHVFLAGRDNMNALEDGEQESSEAYTAYQQGRADYGRARINETRYGTDRWYRVGVRDAHAATRQQEWRDEQQPAGWTPPEPRWRASTFEGFPPEMRDEAEEAWRHRVERVDHWRRQGRITDTEATLLLDPGTPLGVIGDEEVWRRNGTAGRFDPEYADAVEQLSLDADDSTGACRYCRGALHFEHQIRTGPDGWPVMEHPPWNYDEGHGTLIPEQGRADADELVPGDQVAADGRTGVFEYVDDDGEHALVMFEGDTEATRVPKRRLRATQTA
jgi:hypothetical protein